MRKKQKALNLKKIDEKISTIQKMLEKTVKIEKIAEEVVKIKKIQVIKPRNLRECREIPDKFKKVAENILFRKNSVAKLLESKK